MRRRRMGAVPQQLIGDRRINTNVQMSKDAGHGAVLEEIEGLIKVYKDGYVERLPAVPHVPCTWACEPGVTSEDVALAGSSTDLWARLHMPVHRHQRFPLLVYFHGGGFCVGSPAWRCYHEFLARLTSHAACSVLSINYRLAPEHRLPAALEDGLAALRWVRQQAAGVRFDVGRVFLAGDSAGAAIAYHVAAAVGAEAAAALRPACLKGVILIQPFFGGVERTWSEKNLAQAAERSALSLAASDCYWRMALPPGANQDHPWCNPLAKGAPPLEGLRLPPLLVCVSELDILRDRNLAFCKALRNAGKGVEHKTYAGVGHAFQILHNYHMSQVRTNEMLIHIKAFITNIR
ncbi:probable carboxylesterase 17 [Zingiber officinale]|nr:probable carboxylesterase 17 [Zingiber officinale]